jgi:LysM repeat protein
MLLLIILFAPFYRRGRELPTEDLSSIQARLGQLEKTRARPEGMEDRIVFVDRQQKELQRYLAENDRSRGQLAQRLDTLTEKVDRLEKTMGRLTVETKAPPTSQRRPSPLFKGRYHEVRAGDTLYWIAQKYGTSVDELCRLNHINPEQVIYPGQKLVVTPERHQ